MPGQSRWTYYTPEGIDRIIRAARREPDPPDDGQKEPVDSLEAAADELFREFGRARHRKRLKRLLTWRPAMWSHKGLPVYGLKPSLGERAAISCFVEELLWTWIYVFDGRLRTSVHGTTWKAGGPLVHFLSACISELKQRLESGEVVCVDHETSVALTKALCRLTPDALRERVRESAVKSKIIAPLEARLFPQRRRSRPSKGP